MLLLTRDNVNILHYLYTPIDSENMILWFIFCVTSNHFNKKLAFALLIFAFTQISHVMEG